ncbi:hypothetical protein SAMN05216388_1004186 [Halorientalis persicus]|jgi:hypothetical protein|uniref:Uncharacterized protein n=1 Tax=Halorientalis persicus TaxID=1367881 RepID=A0A1H8IK45_9EURY|nr:hypothetical protein [Halorientalis persicus]SEN68649.1 hypothetical protein SAMN05216388_1004186 [Halorientalis persicus]
MTVPLQMLGGYGIGRLVLLLVVPVLVVAFGSYVGVLMALQSFFGASSWQEAVDSSTDES